MDYHKVILISAGLNWRQSKILYEPTNTKIISIRKIL